VLCFGVHPQLPASLSPEAARKSLAALYELAAAGRIDAIGEVGFDLFDTAYRATEALQDELFALQLEIALAKGLPLVLHLRRAMHKAFAYSRSLARLPAVVVHSYPGTLREAQDLVKRGVNAYFSFGTTILLNHKQAMAACAEIPVERLLFESDAPYQPLRGKPFSTYADLRAIIDQAARLRELESAEELERSADENFRRVFLSRGGM
jgi:TatD DNase family protein